jgi:NAD(P)-dependent dehydrogenase (short-subunit alcohol dehydrogenase family)
VPIADVSSRSIPDLISLAGRRAVVTGGARGIGRAIAARFAEAGADVVLADLRRGEAEAAAREIAARFGRRALAIESDVTDADSIARLADAAESALGGLEIWVNNAGIFPSAPLLEISTEQWDRVMDLNVRGVFLATREVGRRWVAKGVPGVLINIGSTGAFKTGPGVAHYITSKHAVVGLTRTAAVELGPHGIRVLGIAPSMTRTEGRQEFLAANNAPGMDAFVAEMERRTPLGRIGVPDDVARVALFCASDLSILMTGSTLMVDAGEGAL